MFSQDRSQFSTSMIQSKLFIPLLVGCRWRLTLGPKYCLRYNETHWRKLHWVHGLDWHVRCSQQRFGLKVRFQPNRLSYRWGLILHWILAVTNSCNWLKWVTRFPCDIFGFYVAFIYLQKGVQVLARLSNETSFYLSIGIALLVFMVAYICGLVSTSSLFRHPIRVFLKDYGTPLTLIFFTGFVHIGRMNQVDLDRLPTSIAFEPTSGRKWLVNFWDLSIGEIFTALPFAILLTILFWFDHNGKKATHFICLLINTSLTKLVALIQLPNYSVFPNRAGQRVSSEKARRFSLGHLPTRGNYWCCRYSWLALS